MNSIEKDGVMFDAVIESLDSIIYDPLLTENVYVNSLGLLNEMGVSLTDEDKEALKETATAEVYKFHMN